MWWLQLVPSFMSCSCGLPRSPFPAVLASLDHPSPLEQFAPSVDRAVFLTLQGSHGIKVSWVMDCTEDVLRTWWHQEGKQNETSVSESPPASIYTPSSGALSLPLSPGPWCQPAVGRTQECDPASTQLRVFLSSFLSLGPRP